MSDRFRLSSRALEFSEKCRLSSDELAAMEHLTRHALAVALSMIEEKGEGHVGATTSAMHIMAAIYFHRHLRRMAGWEGYCMDVESHKPHAIPGWHGLLYLEGVLSREQMRQFRTFEGPNAYPTHLEPVIQIPTGSLGLGPAAASGLAFLDQYLRDHQGAKPPALQISIIGDSEFDEGIIAEFIKERASHGVRGWIDIIDYNRQSLDGNLDEDLACRLADVYTSHGHPVLVLKYGSRLRALFEQSGGTRLRSRIDSLSTSDYHALLRLDGRLARKALSLEDGAFEDYVLYPEGSSPTLAELLESAPLDPQLGCLLSSLDDNELRETLANLGGHDLSMLLAALDEAQRMGGGVAIIAYTVKGWGISSIIGSLSGHWQRPLPEELEALRKAVGSGADVWQRPDRDSDTGRLLAAVAKSRRMAERNGSVDRLEGLPDYEGPEIRPDETVSTQSMIGRQFSWLAGLAQDHPLRAVSERIVTLSADVAYSAGLKDWINECRVWGQPSEVEVCRRYNESPEMNTEPTTMGRHIRLSNVEQFMGILTAAFGKSGGLARQDVFPFAFFYDIFLERFAEMFKYAAFWDARCWFIGTISGLSAPSESGLHHSMLSGVIGHTTPNVITWEPCFPQEVNWIFAEELRRGLQRTDSGRRVRYFRTGSQQVEGSRLGELLQASWPGQNVTELLVRAREGCLAGGVRIVHSGRNPAAVPGRNVVTLVAGGAMALDAVAAASQLEKDGIFANVVTVSCPRLLAKHLGTAKGCGVFPETERLAGVPVITITDSHSSCLSGVARKLAIPGKRFAHVALGVEQFDRSGTREQLLAFHGLDAPSIAARAADLIRFH